MPLALAPCKRMTSAAPADPGKCSGLLPIAAYLSSDACRVQSRVGNPAAKSARVLAVGRPTPKEGLGADLHCVCLPGACLAIGKYGTVEALQHLFHDWRNGHLVQLGLPCLWVKHLQQSSLCEAGRALACSLCPLRRFSSVVRCKNSWSLSGEPQCVTGPRHALQAEKVLQISLGKLHLVEMKRAAQLLAAHVLRDDHLPSPFIAGDDLLNSIRYLLFAQGPAFQLPLTRMPSQRTGIIVLPTCC